jgi:hypothetical protein
MLACFHKTSLTHGTCSMQWPQRSGLSAVASMQWPQCSVLKQNAMVSYACFVSIVHTMHDACKGDPICGTRNHLTWSYDSLTFVVHKQL